MKSDGKGQETNSLNFSRFISSWLARFGEIPDTPVGASVSGWQSIFLCRRRRRCYWRRIFTKSSESLTSTGRRWRRTTSSAWCWHGGVEISHMRQSCVPAYVRAMHIAPAALFVPCGTSMTGPYLTLSLSERNDETPRFQESLSFLSKLVIHRVDDYSPAVRQSFHASRKRATLKRTLVLLAD